jgi:hypothetical protein
MGEFETRYLVSYKTEVPADNSSDNPRLLPQRFKLRVEFVQ